MQFSPSFSYLLSFRRIHCKFVLLRRRQRILHYIAVSAISNNIFGKIRSYGDKDILFIQKAVLLP